MKALLAQGISAAEVARRLGLGFQGAAIRRLVKEFKDEQRVNERSGE